MEKETKLCKFCQEEIKSTAVVCKFCRKKQNIPPIGKGWRIWVLVPFIGPMIMIFGSFGGKIAGRDGANDLFSIGLIWLVVHFILFVGLVSSMV